MNSGSDQIYGVVSGDVVSSTGINNILEILEQVYREAGELFPGSIPMAIDIYGGDSWQILVSEPVKSLRIAVFFRISLRALGIDTRAAVAIGRIESVPKTRVSTGQGEAFVKSGRALKELKDSKSDRLKVILPEGESQEIFEALVMFLDFAISRLSPGQAFAVAGILKGLTQEEIADRWKPDPVAQAAVSKHLRNAEWVAIEHGINVIESRIEELCRLNSV